MLRIAIAAGLLAGCAYQAGSFRDTGKPAFTGQRATVGCLDIAVDRRPDHDGKAVLQYQFGNRCNRPVQVDLGGVAVVGRFTSGEVTLRPYDPRGELLPVRLDGRHAGDESIAYGSPGTGAAASQICVDVSSIERGRTPAPRAEPVGPHPPDSLRSSIIHARPAQWICFATRADVARVEESP